MIIVELKKNARFYKVAAIYYAVLLTLIFLLMLVKFIAERT